MSRIYEYIKLLRINHWMKNLLIFLALIFSGGLLNSSLFVISLFGFISFSFMASAVYIFNDINDINNDKYHFIKKRRPLASGKISIKSAIILLIIMVLLSILINIFLIKNIYGLIVLCIYAILNILYSIYLKKVPLVDVLILVLGFVIRTYYGAFIIDIEISKWLYLTIMMGSFFMSFGKRRNEIIKYKSKYREVLKFYNKDFLDKYMYVSLVLTIVFYSLWSIDSNTILRVGNDYLIYTIPLVFTIAMKYSLDIEKDDYGDPVDIITKDKILMLLSLLLAIIVAIIIYVL